MCVINRIFSVTDEAERSWGQVMLRWEYKDTFAGYLERSPEYYQVEPLYKLFEHQPMGAEREETLAKINHLGVNLIDVKTEKRYSVGPVVVSEKLLLSCPKFDL